MREREDAHLGAAVAEPDLDLALDHGAQDGLVLDDVPQDHDGVRVAALGLGRVGRKRRKERLEAVAPDELAREVVVARENEEEAGHRDEHLARRDALVEDVHGEGEEGLALVVPRRTLDDELDDGHVLALGKDGRRLGHVLDRDERVGDEHEGCEPLGAGVLGRRLLRVELLAPHDGRHDLVAVRLDALAVRRVGRDEGDETEASCRCSLGLGVGGRLEPGREVGEDRLERRRRAVAVVARVEQAEDRLDVEDEVAVVLGELEGASHEVGLELLARCVEVLAHLVDGRALGLLGLGCCGRLFGRRRCSLAHLDVRLRLRRLLLGGRAVGGSRSLVGGSRRLVGGSRRLVGVSRCRRVALRRRSGSVDGRLGCVGCGCRCGLGGRTSLLVTGGADEVRVLEEVLGRERDVVAAPAKSRLARAAREAHVHELRDARLVEGGRGGRGAGRCACAAEDAADAAAEDGVERVERTADAAADAAVAEDLPERAAGTGLGASGRLGRHLALGLDHVDERRDEAAHDGLRALAEPGLVPRLAQGREDGGAKADEELVRVEEVGAGRVLLARDEERRLGRLEERLLRRELAQELERRLEAAEDRDDHGRRRVGVLGRRKVLGRDGLELGEQVEVGVEAAARDKRAQEVRLEADVVGPLVEQDLGQEDEALRRVGEVGRQVLGVGPDAAVAEEARELVADDPGDPAVRGVRAAAVHEELHDRCARGQAKSVDWERKSWKSEL